MGGCCWAPVAGWGVCWRTPPRPLAASAAAAGGFPRPPAPHPLPAGSLPPLPPTPRFPPSFLPLRQILFEETLFQNASDGTPFVKMLQGKGIIPGIKVGLLSCFSCLVLVPVWLWGPCAGNQGRPGWAGARLVERMCAGSPLAACKCMRGAPTRPACTSASPAPCWSSSPTRLAPTLPPPTSNPPCHYSHYCTGGQGRGGAARHRRRDGDAGH